MNNVDNFKNLLHTFGFIIPKDAEFYTVKEKDENYEKIGMKVGEYTHSCHVDTTDFYILLFFNEKTNNVYLKEYIGGLWDLKKVEI